MTTFNKSIGPFIKRDLKLIYILSSLVAVLMTVSSIVSLLFREIIYPTEELLQAFVANDVVNLVVGLPVLLVSMWLTRRHSLVGLLWWPGALLYVLYNYSVYIFAMPFNAAFLLNLTVVSLSLYTLISLLSSIHTKPIQEYLAGNVPERLSGGVLAGFGGLFLLRVVFVMVDLLLRQGEITGSELALHMTDFLFAPAWIIGGWLLWRRKELGYMVGLGLLFQTSMLFVGLIGIMLVKPFLTNEPFAFVDLVVVLIMGLICSIPFVLFMRGVLKSPHST